MKASFRFLVFTLLFILAPASLSGQSVNGNLYGTVVDSDGIPLRGVKVTLSGNGMSQTDVTDAEGKFRFLNLSPGTYQAQAQLEGFSILDYPNIQGQESRNVKVEVTLNPASQTELKIPAARDPWAILQSTSGVMNPLAGDDLFEEKGGGSYSYTDPATGKKVTILVPEGWDEGLPPPDPPAGALPPPPVPDGVSYDNFFLATTQQTSFDEKQAQANSWSVDGVLITDMAAIGSSPHYFDFDSFEEMEVTTGGRGSGRYLLPNIDSDVGDFGDELGGPILRDRLWIWGSSDLEVDLLTIPDIVQHGFQRICSIPGFDTYTFRGAEGQADCREIESSLRNTLGTGAFQRFLYDPFADPPIRVESPAPESWLREPYPIYKIEDIWDFQLSHPLSFTYGKNVDGGLGRFQGGAQAMPTVRIGSDVLPPRYDAFAGWIPSSTLAQYRWDQPPGMGAAVRDLGAPAGGTRTFTVIDREDFMLCQNGIWIGVFNVGTSVDLGNGSAFTPYEAGEVDCDEFEWGKIVPRVGITYALGQDRKTLLGDSYNRFANQLGTGYWDPNGVWFFGGRAFEEEDDDDPSPLSSSPFGMSMGNRILPNPTVLNPADLDRGLVWILAQWFWAQMRFRPGTTSADAQVGPGGSIASSTSPQSSGASGTAMTELEEVPSVLLVSLGNSTGEAFRAYVLGDGPPSIEGMAMLKPVDASPAVVAQLEQRMRSAGAAMTTVDAFCFEFDKQVPPAGTAYVFASPSEQQRFEPLARVVEAGKRVLDAGGLTPDPQLDTYYPSITQWAIWTREKGFDMESFGEAWLGHVRKNAEQSGQPFTDELARIVKERVPGRWRDIQKILEEADRIATPQ